MIEWREEGIVLSVRRLGENDAIVDAFTPQRGRHAGVVRGGGGRRLAPLLQPGGQLLFAWRARLEDHLGAFTVEAVRSRAGLMGDPLALAALDATTALLAYALPEREGQPHLYAATLALLDLLEDEDEWPLAYLRWEMGLLNSVGFGLDLQRCAVTGARDDLAFVSPRTGRAVARDAAGRWADRLLPLPGCLAGQGPASAGELLDGLRVTGHFLEGRLVPALGDRPLPPARARLIARMARQFSA
ncbi:RecO [Oceaniovalibus guishaninsula JLT2003]|uniref:DNA repair protein RecO n=1 Tax=Oceaniovalibus guishaninsula JLT2003 TaxID=1231392 RepID=K2HBT6_9RHOB|nr:DNA repair protein RecO [Oceaniovalibus guishaninsula]EKE44077.1 RecO [Oceaniovalibus guishaninsula JLT2003]